MTDPVDRYVNRGYLEETLCGYTCGTTRPIEFKTWIKELIVGDGVEFEESEAELLLRVIQSLDASAASETLLESRANELGRILSNVESPLMAETIILIVEERLDVVRVIEKYLAGIVSRTSFLSFITERCWLPNTKWKVETRNRHDLECLAKALKEGDYARVSTILSE